MARKLVEEIPTPSGKPGERADPAWLVTAQPGSPEGKLQVGQSVLRFHSTIPNRESYLILKVTPPSPGAAVSLSTDMPEVFQLAVGVDTLTFMPTLTFTPQEKGTYVHLRYLPRLAGSHRAQLTVQTDDETLTVWLLGRTRGMRGLVRARHQSARTGWALKMLVGVLLFGLAYAGYQYRCQLMPSLCTAPTRPAVTVTPEPPAPTTAPVAKITPTKKRRPTASRPADVASPPRSLQGNTARPTQPVTLTETPAVTGQESPKVVKKAAGSPDKVTQKPDPTPAPRARPGAESDLERALNRPENQ